MGNIILSHESALEFWRLYSCGSLLINEDSLVKCTRSVEVARSTSLLTASDTADLRQRNFVLRQLCLPLTTIVDKPEKRSKNKLVHSRLVGFRPTPGSFWQIGENLYVCSPELLFMQLVSMDFIKGLLVGHELCGTYTDASIESLIDAKPRKVTSTQQVRAYLGKVKGYRGVADARRAARYLKDNSASPMESKLSIEYGLHKKMGGRGFPQFELNHVTQLPPRFQQLHGTKCLVSDLYWPDAKVGCEYDSAEWHTNETKIAADNFRAAVLEAVGVTVFSLRKNHVLDYVTSERYAEVLLSKLGKRRRIELSEQLVQKRIELRSQLYGSQQENCFPEAMRYEQTRLLSPRETDWSF